MKEPWRFSQSVDHLEAKFDDFVEAGARTPDPPGVHTTWAHHLAVDDSWLSSILTPTGTTILGPVAAEDLCSKLAQLQAQQQLEQTTDARSGAFPFAAHKSEQPRTVEPAWSSRFSGGFPCLDAATSWAASAVPPPQPPPGLDRRRDRERRAEACGQMPHVTQQMPFMGAAALGTQSQNSLTSLGSLGHPVRCAQACKYVKRKGGCKEGAQCLCCHQCFWHRDAPPKELPPSYCQLSTALRKLPEALLASVGSQGHPKSCSSACKYLRRRGGCRDGALCPNCHLCRWQRVSAPTAEEEAKAPAAAELPGSSLAVPQVVIQARGPGERTPSEAVDSVVDCPGGEKAVRWSVSVGSIGHPHCCSPACKHSTSSTGCKEGHLCKRCHLCKWSPHLEAGDAERPDTTDDAEASIHL